MCAIALTWPNSRSFNLIIVILPATYQILHRIFVGFLISLPRFNVLKSFMLNNIQWICHDNFTFNLDSFVYLFCIQIECFHGIVWDLLRFFGPLNLLIGVFFPLRNVSEFSVFNLSGIPLARKMWPRHGNKKMRWPSKRLTNAPPTKTHCMPHELIKINKNSLHQTHVRNVN